MSAWIVSENHIRVLVEALYRYEVIDGKVTPDQLGKDLWRENHRSVNYHYNERSRTPRYVHDSTAQCVDRKTPLGEVRVLVRQPWTVFSLVSCFTYQTCEHPTWEKSKAFRYMEKLEQVILKTLGCDADAAHEHPNYRKGPWGVD